MIIIMNNYHYLFKFIIVGDSSNARLNNRRREELPTLAVH